MRVDPRCVPCILASAYRIALMVADDRVGRLELMRLASMELGRRLSPEITSCRLSGLMFEALSRACGVDDPYMRLKAEDNRAALKLVGDVEEMLSRAGTSYQRFRLAVEYSVAANAADYGVFMGSFTYGGDLGAQLRMFRDKGLALDEIDLFYDYASRGGSTLYLLDNCGEIVFDILLIKELKRLGCRVTAVVKERPCLNDVTVREALEVGLDKAADRLISTGSNTCGLGVHGMDLEFERALKESDLIVCKGQANYEDLSEIEGMLKAVIVYLLVVKCELIARVLGVEEVGGAVVKCVCKGSS
ncbi:MAG: damage-control phosphatase ARMT1 family protein, partial [Candidatus Bathyarchaeia archaeon]